MMSDRTFFLICAMAMANSSIAKYTNPFLHPEIGILMNIKGQDKIGYENGGLKAGSLRSLKAETGNKFDFGMIFVGVSKVRYRAISLVISILSLIP